jgi:alanine dehydrogenase
VQPVRQVLDIGTEPSFFAVMPASTASPAAVGAKLVTVYPKNHERGLPSHLATIILLDPDTGGLLALLDGRYVTEARTAAVSAVSVKLLARPESRVLGIVGSGVQARSHLDAIRLVRHLTEVRVWSPNAAHREAFARENTTDRLPVRAVSDARSAVHGADIIALTTASRVPVIDDGDVAPGTHVCAVGACRPDQREMPTSLVVRARVFVDSRVAALKEAGDLLLPISEGAITEAHIAGELGALARGQVAGRTKPTDVTIFKSLGLAVEDVLAARLVVERATAAQLGHRFDLA